MAPLSPPSNLSPHTALDGADPAEEALSAPLRRLRRRSRGPRAISSEDAEDADPDLSGGGTGSDRRERLKTGPVYLGPRPEPGPVSKLDPIGPTLDPDMGKAPIFRPTWAPGLGLLGALTNTRLSPAWPGKWSGQST
ncbi:uncharacterized protein A4U43_C06F6230 [Asparagus officinalis]|uniref:Uncharacterized protein n=1 Tax=Asparagus officinalis TaxID=4686 RepID=A0A5P1EK75_ASPOF|nr:uncharacterized protein A4U43_C06F6230 [Asparagus officinalis]